MNWRCLFKGHDWKPPVKGYHRYCSRCNIEEYGINVIIDDNGHIRLKYPPKELS